MPSRDLDDIHGTCCVPLGTLAREGQELSDAAASERVKTALHEATHLLAAIMFRAAVVEARITPSGKPNRRGAYGRVQALERLECEGALISYVGFAWEERHGDLVCGRADFEDGNRLAAQAGIPREVLLHNAREFVRVGEGPIRVVAACLLARLPKSGILKGGSLRRLVKQFAPPPHERPPEGYLSKKLDLGEPM